MMDGDFDQAKIMASISQLKGRGLCDDAIHLLKTMVQQPQPSIPPQMMIPMPWCGVARFNSDGVGCRVRVYDGEWTDCIVLAYQDRSLLLAEGTSTPRKFWVDDLALLQWHVDAPSMDQVVLLNSRFRLN